MGRRACCATASAVLTAGRPPTLTLPREGGGDHRGGYLLMFHLSRPAEARAELAMTAARPQFTPVDVLISPKVRNVISNNNVWSRTAGARGTPGVALTGSVMTDE